MGVLLQWNQMYLINNRFINKLFWRKNLSVILINDVNDYNAFNREPMNTFAPSSTYKII